MGSFKVWAMLCFNALSCRNVTRLTVLLLAMVSTPTLVRGQAIEPVFEASPSASQSMLNIYQPPEFFANPNINITPLESPPRIQALDLPNYQLFKQQLSEQHGFDYLLAYTPLFQLGERGQDYMDAELDFGFVWNLYDDGCSQGNVLAYMLWVQTFSNMPTGEFSQQYGVVTQPNSGATDPNFATTQLNILAWEQTWLDESISLRVGQLRNDFFFGTNKYHNDDRYVFLHTVLSGLQGANWAATGKGIGAMFDVRCSG